MVEGVDPPSGVYAARTVLTTHASSTEAQRDLADMGADDEVGRMHGARAQSGSGACMRIRMYPFANRRTVF